MPTLTVCRNLHSNWSILNASSDSEVCRFAAEELQRYLKLLSGCLLPIQDKLREEDVFLVGLRRDIPATDRQNIPVPAEGFDGYAISINERSICIAGDNERGVLYGVYDLLERLGCRWFYPMQDPKDPEVVPKLDAVSFETGTWSIASPIPIRLCNASSFFFEIVPEIMRTQLDVAMKARYNGMAWQCDHRSPVGDQYREMERAGIIDEIKKRGMLFHGPAHSFQHFLRDDDYFESHPEWFGMRDGKRVHQVYGGSQFCWSNSQARRQFVLNAERFVLDCPALDIF
ncbi:MAG TPA: alpha-glucuronidase family glycosyl hydrolase, partial [bacterium]|nr:alpha-glucuronidase family glycosyl hydrolase [bacterium]